MGMIEFTRNRYLQKERDAMENAIDTNDMLTFWQWENKLLKQEVDYYEKHLRAHKAKIDQEV